MAQDWESFAKCQSRAVAYQHAPQAAPIDAAIGKQQASECPKGACWTGGHIPGQLTAYATPWLLLRVCARTAARHCRDARCARVRRHRCDHRRRRHERRRGELGRGRRERRDSANRRARAGRLQRATRESRRIAGRGKDLLPNLQFAAMRIRRHGCLLSDQHHGLERARVLGRCRGSRETMLSRMSGDAVREGAIVRLQTQRSDESELARNVSMRRVKARRLAQNR